MSLDLRQFQETLSKAGLLGPIPPDSLPPLLQFSQKMLHWNESLNLTRWTEDEDFLRYHLLDSAYAVPLAQELLLGSAHWLDLGTGCGFPGAAIAAANPTWEVTFLDSVAKKTKALEDCLQGTGWKAQALAARAEDLGRDPKTRETFDGVSARAVADLPVVLEYALPLLRVGGYFVNWMTEEQLAWVERSKKALESLQGRIAKSVPYSLPGLAQPRALLVVEKLGKTPQDFPRAAGVPSKRPL